MSRQLSAQFIILDVIIQFNNFIFIQRQWFGVDLVTTIHGRNRRLRAGANQCCLFVLIKRGNIE